MLLTRPVVIITMETKLIAWHYLLTTGIDLGYGYDSCIVDQSYPSINLWLYFNKVYIFKLYFKNYFL